MNTHPTPTEALLTRLTSIRPPDQEPPAVPRSVEPSSAETPAPEPAAADDPDEEPPAFDAERDDSVAALLAPFAAMSAGRGAGEAEPAPTARPPAEDTGTGAAPGVGPAPESEVAFEVEAEVESAPEAGPQAESVPEAEFAPESEPEPEAATASAADPVPARDEPSSAEEGAEEDLAAAEPLRAGLVEAALLAPFAAGPSRTAAAQGRTSGVDAPRRVAVPALAGAGAGTVGGGAYRGGSRGAGEAGGESISQPPARIGGPRRRGPADPVRAVMHRHHAMVAGAVDVWEVAAGLEACGVSDGEARRLRHRDVFGLAEELYARVPRSGRAAVEEVPPAVAGGRRWPGKAVTAHLLPGAGCVLAAGLPVAAAPAAVAVAVALWWVLRHGPLRVAHAAGAAVWTYGLLAFALYGPQAVTALAGRGHFDAGAGTAAFAALALSLLPAAALARWFAGAARAQLAPSHGLADFADAVRPRLAAALAGYAAALAGLLLVAAALAGSVPLAGPLALGVLLFTARLLAAHGQPAPAAAGLAAACTAEALSLVLAAAPGHLAPSGTTVEAALCGAAALVLAAQALRLLGRAAAHRPQPYGRT